MENQVLPVYIETKKKKNNNMQTEYIGYELLLATNQKTFTWP